MDTYRFTRVPPMPMRTGAPQLTGGPARRAAPLLTTTALFAATTLLTTPAILAPTPAAAQQVTVLREDLCTTCSIEVTPDVELGTDGESVIGVAWDIHRLPDGRFVMAFQDVTYEFTIFSADGSN